MKNYDKPRQTLKEAGWKRRDRRNTEYWEAPWDGIGFRYGLYTFEQAWNKYTKDEREHKKGRTGRMLGLQAYHNRQNELLHRRMELEEVKKGKKRK